MRASPHYVAWLEQLRRVRVFHSFVCMGACQRTPLQRTSAAALTVLSDVFCLRGCMR